MFARLLTTLLGVALFVYGVIAAASPLPLGVPLVVLGLLMIAGANPAARPLLRRMRARWRWFDRLVEALAKGLPENMRTLVAETDPDNDSRREGEKNDGQIPNGKGPA